MSASSLSYSGSPRPTGMPVACTRMRAPQESPALRSASMYCSYCATSATGAKKGLLRTWSQCSNGMGSSPNCVMQARNRGPYCRGSHFLASGAGRWGGGGGRGGGAAAAARVANAVLAPVAVVGVAGAKTLGAAAVVFAALVGIADQQRDRRARGLALVDAGEYFHRIRLVALRDMAAAAWPPPVQVGLYVGLGQGHAGRAAVDHAANGRAVGFAKIGDCKQGAEGV